jgi:hypothetical protein
MIATFKAQHPELIMEQILRVDFFQDSTTGRYILNEMEGFNAQVVGLRSGDGATDAMELVKGYWKEKIILLAHRCQIS